MFLIHIASLRNSFHFSDIFSFPLNFFIICSAKKDPRGPCLPVGGSGPGDAFLQVKIQNKMMMSMIAVLNPARFVVIEAKWQFAVRVSTSEDTRTYIAFGRALHI